MRTGVTAAQIVPVVDEGLGNSSYVVGLGDGGALVVDPSRDPSPYLSVAEAHGWRIRFVAETHVHADFVSGSRQLAVSGAQVIASAGAPLSFDALHVTDSHSVDLGGLTLRAIATPGHTPEHLAYLLVDGQRAVAVFTGGTLTVGGVARPDLLGDDVTEPLARAAYRSLHDQLLSLPDDLAVYPTHGAGSFCSTTVDRRRITTIGEERASNPLASAADEDAFVAKLLAGLGSYPPYFLELRDVNRAGPAVYDVDGPTLAELDVVALDRAMDDGAVVVDVRPAEAFATAHIPGSLSIPLRAQLATWLGWLVDRRRPVVFVTDATTDRRRLVWAALKVGHDRLAGMVDGGVTAWVDAGRPAGRATIADAAAARRDRRRVVDVRQQVEWESGHLTDAVHVELGALAAGADAVTGGPVVVHCGHGERAMTGASVLLRRGHHDVAVWIGTPAELAAARGAQLTPG